LAEIEKLGLEKEAKAEKAEKEAKKEPTPFKCSHCDKSSSHKSHLALHERTANGK
jgi:hypothetical protein